MADIKVIYDGKWPCLCMGHLKINIDGILWDFGTHALSSGGHIEHDGYFNNWETYSGEWTIDDYSWPKDFPEDMKKAVLDKVNEEIPWGCCGGCI